jgi:hypothetical protein
MRKKGPGDAFLAEVEKAIQRILDFPEGWPTLEHGARVCATHRFKYGVVYVIMSERIVIVAVMHLHRRPGYWKKRLRELPRDQ